MKIFLKKIIVFITTFYATLLFAFATSNYIINKRANFKLESNINKVIIGNSQPQCAYNDTIITNFKNLAKSGETYFYNYHKLKAIIKQNPQIDTVFIEFSNANILKREDEKIWQTSYVNHHLPNYSFLIDWKSYYLIVLKNPVGLQTALLTTLKNNIHRIGTSSYNYKDSIGNYWYLKRQKAQAALDTITPQKLKFKKINDSQLNTYDIKYLEKIIVTCQKNDITPFLIRSPYHPKFRVEQYEWNFQKVLKKRFKNISFLDFKNFPLKTSEYGDLQHLNYKGARKYSLFFSRLLLNNKL